MGNFKSKDLITLLILLVDYIIIEGKIRNKKVDESVRMKLYMVMIISLVLYITFNDNENLLYIELIFFIATLINP